MRRSGVRAPPSPPAPSRPSRLLRRRPASHAPRTGAGSAPLPDTTPLDIPFDPADLTPAWLDMALHAGGVLGEAHVRACAVEPIAADRAFAGRPVRVRLEYDRAAPGAPPTLVAKFPAADPTLRRALAGLRWYESELRFYELLAPAGPLRTPRRFFSAMHRPSLAYVLLMEEVAGRHGDQLAGASAEEARAVVAAIASFHAAWWAHPRLDALPWLAVGPVRRLEHAEGWARFLRGAWTAVRPLLEPLLAPAERARLDAIAVRLCVAYAAALRVGAAPPRTLLHGDCRLDNVLFGLFSAAGEPPTFLDWQLLSSARGPYDLAYFLGTNLQPGRRAVLEEELLRSYHATVAAAAPGYTIEQCRHDYRLGMLLAFAFWVQTAGAGTFPAAAVPLRDAALQRLSQALLDLDAEGLLAELGA